MGFYDGQLQPLSVVYENLLTDIYKDVLGREPTKQEIKKADTNKIVLTGKLKPEIDKVVYSQEAYNRIAQLDKAIMGHDVSESTIRDQQSQLSQFNFITYDKSPAYVSRVSTMSDIRNDFAFSPSVREAVVNMLTNMGVNPSEQDITWSQDRFAEGKDAQWVRYEHAHGYHGDYAARQLMSSILGRAATDGDSGWLNAMKDGLGNGMTYQQLLSQEAHGFLGDYAAKELLQKIYGRSATDSDTAWLNMVKYG
ncbi:hypothetical protein COMX_06480 [Commensalibacter papalotli (ex Servin-Garciduenas et al. 2014)]|uniref:Uncharacterized protein n=1 Tax=Commensalibacter papalotli (ex Servin-Garciduenas et al. 2014) TaxID=1208583 RepID=W7E8A0_9PROT|nr:hypothetical protein COMX_06480 [Commensalibacter papalotli (ex Servin-Garciduenas et al. 2014)]